MKNVRRAWGIVMVVMGFLLVALPVSADEEILVWTGPGRNWHDPNNWSPQRVPNVNDEVSIGSNFSISLDSNVKIRRITVGSGTRMTGSGDLSITSGGFFTDVRLGGSGVLRVEAGAGLNILTSGYSYGAIPPASTGAPVISGNVNTRFDRSVLNYGVTNWDGGNLLIYQSLTNAPGSVFRVRGTGALVKDPLAASSLSNQGTIVKTSTGDSKTNLPFNNDNSGTLTAQAGTLYFYNGFSQKGGTTSLKGGTIFSQSTMAFAGGALNGSGTINGAVKNSGARFTPGNSPGAVVINGNYTQTSDGTLQMELGGVAPGTQYDQLTVNGTAVLNGTLEIVQYNGFVPVAGNSFQLVKYLASVGNFSTVKNLFVTPGNYFTTTKTPSYLVAQPVADASLPTVAVTAPKTDTGYASLLQATGTASDVGSGVSNVTIKLFRYAGAAPITAGYWNGSTWDAVYSVKNDLPATGTTAWSFTMPALSAGKYDLTATARDKANNAKVSTKIIFWIDATLPKTPVFTAPLNNAIVANLSTIRGTASDSGSGLRRVDLRIKKNSNGTYWNGTTWVVGSVYLRATLTGGVWSLTNSAATPLPTGALLPNGSYQLTALAVDKAELKRSASINVTVQTAPVALQEGSDILDEPSQ